MAKNDKVKSVGESMTKPAGSTIIGPSGSHGLKFSIRTCTGTNKMYRESKTDEPKRKFVATPLRRSSRIRALRKKDVDSNRPQSLTPEVMTTQFQQTAEMQPEHVSQSQPTQKTSSVVPRKRVKFSLPCMQCKDSFGTEWKLKAHIRYKHITPYKCDHCWKAFSFKSELKRHVITHTGEKPYKCDVCPKGYTRQVALYNHLRLHVREKFFKCCTYCRKGFKNEKRLKKHERMHFLMGD